MKTAKLTISFLVGTVILFTMGPTPARVDSGLAISTPPTFEDPNDPVEVETFLDQVFNQQIEKFHLAGISAVVVKDGQVFFQKGYGYSDVAKQIPVDPAETIFRIGSISKLFTWTAVMQLAEQGKIDLNADINTYLPDFQIPDTFPEPITMRNLMTHTAGFEDRATGIEARSPEDMISLHDCLASYLPDRIRPAGELTSYSNFGTALAGYIVEVVSGMPFEQYIETYIFEPLSMSHSTFRQPLPPVLQDQLANSYSYKQEYVPGSFTYVNLRPAGAMSSTAHDMANFILAHLQEGRFEDLAILKPETMHLMHTHLFSNDERLDGVAYGFFEETVNGKRVLWHSGDIGNYHSILAIIPDDSLGFFVNYNSNEGYPAVNEFYYSVLNAYFPAQKARVPSATQNSTQDDLDLAGEYRSTRSVNKHIERIGYFPGNGNLTVGVNPDQTLSIAGGTFYENEPLVYSLQDGSNTAIFHRDSNGKITHMLFNGIPFFAYERLSWYETSTFNLLAFGACYVLLLTGLLAAIVGIFKRRKGMNDGTRLPGLARIWSISVSVVFFFLPAAVAIYITYDYRFLFPFYMVIVLGTILAASILVIGPLIFTFLAWRRRFWSLAGRIHYTLITLALLGMVWLTYYWNLLGFRY
jgi:CubicO group peptidase (beta-lactamase class C family)